MRSVLLIVLVFSAGAICATAAFYLLHDVNVPVVPQQSVTEEQSEAEVVVQPPQTDIQTNNSQMSSTTLFSDDQIETANSFGIDLESFVVTPEMIECAKDVLSTERITAILTGEVPTFSESISLIGCLR